MTGAGFPTSNGIGRSNGVANIMDGSWELRILVTDLQVERTIRVKGDLHIGGVMIKLVDELGKIECRQTISAKEGIFILSIGSPVIFYA